MIRLYKIIIATFLLPQLFLALVFANNPDSFIVEVNPYTFLIGEPVDLTITANKDGEILKDYLGDVFININGLSPSEYDTPSKGYYLFSAEDLGTKTFSKGLYVNKAGTYQVIVEDVSDELIVGKATIIVSDPNKSDNLKEINITSPINGSTEKKDSINLIGSAFDIRNSPIDIYLNSELVGNTQTDNFGGFSFYLSDLIPGENKIQIKAKNVDDMLIGESSIIGVVYEELSDDIFDYIKILPSGSLKQGDKAVFEVYTLEDVSSVDMKFSDGTSYPLDKISFGVFSKELTMMDYGAKDVSLSLIINGESRNYLNIASFLVQQNNSVGNIKFVTTGVDGTSVLVSWNSIGNAERYRILYGIDRENLQKTVDVGSTEILIENLQESTNYYFQIIPLDSDFNPSGNFSEIVEYSPADNKSCVVKGIEIVSEKIGDKYFLIWDEVENVKKYEIYRSDREDMSDMKKVGETTGTQFEYFFDIYSDKDIYAYYQVQAICLDGSDVIVDKVQKVQVGPLENTLLIVIVTLFVYSVLKLYRFAKD